MKTIELSGIAIALCLVASGCNQSLEKRAEKGDADAQYELAELYLKDSTKVEEGIEFLKQAAQNDNVEAQVILGSWFYYGINVKQDYSTALAWWQLAAEKGEKAALYNIGYCHDKGRNGS